MSKIQQTKGYLTLEGKVKFMGEKSLKIKPRSKEVIFGLETKEGNIITVRAFGWNKEDDDLIYVSLKEGGTEPVPYGDRFFLEEGKTLIGTAIKPTKDSEVSIMVEVDAVELIHSTFKNGDTVFISANSEVDTYYNNLKWVVNKIYASTEDLDFNSENFEETNHGKQWIAFDKVEENTLFGFVVSRKEDILPIKFELDTRYIEEADFVSYEKGDLIQLDFEFIRTAIYEEVEDKQKPNIFKGKGKYAKADNGNGTYMSIKGFEEKYVCVGLSNEKKKVIEGEELHRLYEDESTPF